ncbi:hypothetical protein C8046_03940 [Serinibacter arcticus]|uniref:Uncharacterized protein n=1 Tax=Serinibacter arcticus TaxID=1655435 RepID=A0A2U1ZSK1_9MICO|nr:hypothetical protein [Serinibacter arcticus]PWD49956.1 hypothetical protein C8046_03940 [Serinibacter arcticus]
MLGIYGDVPTWDDGRQEILNAYRVPRRWTAAPFPPGPVAVVARIVWSVDGEQLRDTRATAWTPRFVLVEVFDRRWYLNAAWLRTRDVRRRSARPGRGRAGGTGSR